MNNTNDLFADSVIDKLDIQEKQLSELATLIKNMADQPEAVDKITAMVEKVEAALLQLKFPEKEMQQLNARLMSTTILLKQPVETKVVHHHYVPRLTWIAAGLFLTICLVTTGWYHTYSRINFYKANDTKYRYLKILKGNNDLIELLNSTDSLYNADTHLRDKVVKTEEQNQLKLEKLQQANELEKKAADLKKEAADKMKDEH